MLALKPYLFVDYFNVNQPVIYVYIQGSTSNRISNFTDAPDPTRSALVLTYQLTNDVADVVIKDDIINITDLSTTPFSNRTYPKITVKLMKGTTCIATVTSSNSN